MCPTETGNKLPVIVLRREATKNPAIFGQDFELAKILIAP